MPIQKKKQSWLARLGARIRTPKGRLIATVLVFAAIGGGILVYRSFAARHVWGYTIAQGNLQIPPYNNSGCKSSKTYDSQFNANVFVLYCDKSVTGATARASMVGAYLPAGYQNISYRVCAYLKGKGEVIVAGNPWDGGTPNYRSLNVINSTNYGYYCSPPFTKKKVGDLTGYVETNPNVQNFISVGGMTLEML